MLRHSVVGLRGHAPMSGVLIRLSFGRNSMRRSTTALIVLGVIAFSACGDDPADAVPETLELSFTGLEPLINGDSALDAIL